jgi:hypothetical protein|tara:strand:+ start:100 stop:672 length:573 start_codon:yes stop_codon:yes gene_type:complete
VFNRDSDAEWVRMNFDVPIDIILKEYTLIKDSLITHRPEDGHKDWCAVTLYGFDSDKTNSHWEYDRKKQKPKVTHIGEKCIKTVEWVKSLPYSRIDDIRFLVIKPNGYITKHIDVPDRNWLEPLNICLTFPKGNKFTLNNKEVSYTPGMPLVLNIHYEHSVENNSDEERIHLLVHGKKKKEFWDDVYSWR